METLVLEQLVGQTVSEYRVEELLSHGRLSAVYRAYRLKSSRPVALTLLLLSEEESPQAQQQFRTRFLQEAPRLVEVHHPNLLPVYDYGVWEGLPYLITATGTEGSLETLLAQQGPYTPEGTVVVLEQVTAGLEYAHRHGLVHGMLTPAHLFLSQQQPLHIVGLGLLRLLERRGLLPSTDAHASLFTPAGTHLVPPKYLAPEYLQGRPATIRSDVYSLGVILLELLSGLLSVKEADLQERIMPWEWGPEISLEGHGDTLPLALKQVVRRALAADPLRRFQRASDLLAAWAAGVEEQAAQEVSNDRIDALFPVSPLPAVGTSSPEADNSIPEAEVGASDAFARQRSPTRSPSQTAPSGSPDGSRRGRISAPRHGGISRRRVTALLAGGLAVGVIGVGGIKVASLLHPGGAGRSSPASSVIGHTNQALNKAQAFNQPGETEHPQRLLIHLPDGAFVAYKQGCTHSGVLVAYDPQTHMLVCPAHGAIFDPAQGGRVLRGPATRPLPQVTIHVNSDGTITTR